MSNFQTFEICNFTADAMTAEKYCNLKAESLCQHYSFLERLRTLQHMKQPDHAFAEQFDDDVVHIGHHTASKCKCKYQWAWRPQYQQTWVYTLFHKTVLSSLRNRLDLSKEMQQIIHLFHLVPNIIPEDIPSATKDLIA